jgi:hypothetical protein
MLRSASRAAASLALPAAGVVPHVHVPGGVAETNVVFGGVDCVSVAFGAAVVVLLFVTVSV